MSDVSPDQTDAEIAMTCPRCGGEMRTHERNGVTIEQCRKCHGIFLDRGEFEQLMGRETSYLGNGDSLSGQGAGGSGRARWKKPWRR
jgi:Zn-finger nucleic acid-binding protein